MRVYIHYEEGFLGPVHTKKVTIKNPDAPASEALAEFVKSFNATHGENMDGTQVGLSMVPAGTKRLISLDDTLTGIIKDKGECFVVSTGQPSVSSSPSIPVPLKVAATTASVSGSGSGGGGVAASSKAAATVSAVTKTTVTTKTTTKTSAAALKLALTKAADKSAKVAAALAAKGQVKQAREAYERILKGKDKTCQKVAAAPGGGGGSSPSAVVAHAPSLFALGELAMAQCQGSSSNNQQQASKAAAYFNKVVEAAIVGAGGGGSSASGGGGGGGFEDRLLVCEALLGMGKATQQLGQAQGALECYQRALKLLGGSIGGAGSSGAGGAGASGGVGSSDRGKLLTVNVKVAMAGLLLNVGRAQDAADLVTSALAPPEFSDHVEVVHL